MDTIINFIHGPHKKNCSFLLESRLLTILHSYINIKYCIKGQFKADYFDFL